MTDIGRAGMVMKGNYNSAATYETLDAVSYNNGLYIAKQNVPVNILPTNTTYWQRAATATDITTKTAIEFTTNSGFTVSQNDSYSIADGFIYVRLQILADTALNSRAQIGQFSGIIPNTYIAVIGISSSTPGSYVDGVINGFIDTLGNLYLGDYVSNTLGAKEISINMVFHL